MIKLKPNSKLPGVKNFWVIDKPQTNNLKHKAQEEDSSEQNDNKKQKLTGSERFKNFVEEEKRIRKIEDSNADPNADPHSPDQFERVLMKDINKSFLWIKYMAYYLETADIEKARGVGKKALQQISFREEAELLNIWIALLNLEIRFGSEETYNDALKEACQRSDPFKIYTRTTSILLDVGKHNEANQIVDILLKKYKPESDMWLTVCEAYLKMNQLSKTKQLLSKSLLSIKETEHVNYMVKFALICNRHEHSEFAQIIFEKILTTYSKKLNIWFSYIDMLVKNEDIEIARQTFERLLTNTFPLKKMKSIFQKYIEFETKNGDKGNIAKIKKIATSMVGKE